MARRNILTVNSENKNCIRRYASNLIRKGILFETVDFYLATAELSVCGEA